MIKNLLVALLLVTPLFAGDIETFQTTAFQQNGHSSVTLGPGLDPLLKTEFGTYLGFGTSFNGEGQHFWSALLELPGFVNLKNYDHYLCFNPPYSCEILFSWQVPTSYDITQGELLVSVDGFHETYKFRYQDSTPEPSSLTLLGLGLSGVVLRRYLRS